MKYFFDTEFDEDGQTIELISIGVVAEDGRAFYRVSTDFDAAICNDWVKTFVLPQLPPRAGPNGVPNGAWASRERIARELLFFVGDKPEFWAYYADYDWVVLCQLYGRMIDLPTGWPMYCRDIKQLADDLGNPKLPEQESGEHNALEDARWNLQAYQFLTKRRGRIAP